MFLTSGAMMSGIEMSKELAAMVAVERVLQDLSVPEVGRVINWAASRFDVGVTQSKANAHHDVGGASDSSREDGPASQPASSLAEFYDAARPSSDAEKVLVVGYWLQLREGAVELEAQRINTELKHLGYGIGNVTRALDWHKAQKPALMIQKRKEGTSRQARKKFTVTNEGRKYVDRMVEA